MELGDADVAHILAIEGLQAKIQVYARSLSLRAIARIFMLRTSGYITSEDWKLASYSLLLR